MEEEEDELLKGGVGKDASLEGRRPGDTRKTLRLYLYPNFDCFSREQKEKRSGICVFLYFKGRFFFLADVVGTVMNNSKGLRVDVGAVVQDGRVREFFPTGALGTRRRLWMLRCMSTFVHLFLMCARIRRSRLYHPHSLPPSQLPPVRPSACRSVISGLTATSTTYQDDDACTSGVVSLPKCRSMSMSRHRKKKKQQTKNSLEK